MIRFSIFGIPVEVQPFFWISLVFIGAYGGTSTADEIFKVLLFVIAGFISVLVHELGHALTARHFGANTSITLQAFGGYAAYSGVSMSRPRSFLITAAGPAIQIVLGLIVLPIYWYSPTLSDNGDHFLWTLMAISFFWAILNLLPVLPLDGGRMLEAVLGPARIKITLWITIVVSVSVAVGSLLLDPKDFIFPLFMGLFAWRGFQGLKENSWR